MASAEEPRAYRAQAGISRDELDAKVSYSLSLIAMIETGDTAGALRLCLRLGDESAPCVRGQSQHGVDPVLGVPDEHSAVMGAYFYAVAALGT